MKVFKGTVARYYELKPFEKFRELVCQWCNNVYWAEYSLFKDDYVVSLSRFCTEKMKLRKEQESNDFTQNLHGANGQPGTNSQKAENENLLQNNQTGVGRKKGPTHRNLAALNLQHFHCGCSSTEFEISDPICMPYFIIDLQVQLPKNYNVKSFQTFVDKSITDQLDMNLGDNLEVTGFLYTTTSKLVKDNYVEFLPKFYCMSAAHVQSNRPLKNPVLFELVPKNHKYDLKHMARDIQRRNKLLKSFCPELFKSYSAKFALVLSCIGGIFFHGEDAVVTRGNINVLLYGEVYSGRNDLLNFLNRLFVDSSFIELRANLKEDLNFGECKSSIGKSLECGYL
jgi:DNA replicative helicase MCM subunit Mcm2 (Cdc46/Mcm family)